MDSLSLRREPNWLIKCNNKDYCAQCCLNYQICFRNFLKHFDLFVIREFTASILFVIF